MGRLPGCTVMLAAAVLPPCAAVIVAVPVLMPATTPFDDTTATSVSELLQATLPFTALPDASRACAARIDVCRAAIVAVEGVIVIVATPAGGAAVGDGEPGVDASPPHAVIANTMTTPGRETGRNGRRM